MNIFLTQTDIFYRLTQLFTLFHSKKTSYTQSRYHENKQPHTIKSFIYQQRTASAIHLPVSRSLSFWEWESAKESV